jgi:hypothetical protein
MCRDFNSAASFGSERGIHSASSKRTGDTRNEFRDPMADTRCRTVFTNVLSRPAVACFGNHGLKLAPATLSFEAIG